jgi:hypothetical protein
MKKLVIAAFAAGLIGLVQANELQEENGGQNWRITAGGFARGSMKAKIGNLSDRVVLYGGDIDLYYRAVEANGFTLWAGIGGTFTPYQDAGKVSFYEKMGDQFTSIELGGKGEFDVGYGEFRMMLVPEYEITSNWSLGGRIGVAFDWLRARGKLSTWSKTSIVLSGDPPVFIPVDEFASEQSSKYSEFVAQAILGLQTTYLFTDNLGLYASIDYRIGGEAKFKKHGKKAGTLDMDGWYAGVGIIVQF